MFWHLDQNEPESKIELVRIAVLVPYAYCLICGAGHVTTFTKWGAQHDVATCDNYEVERLFGSWNV